MLLPLVHGELKIAINNYIDPSAERLPCNRCILLISANDVVIVMHLSSLLQMQ